MTTTAGPAAGMAGRTVPEPARQVVGLLHPGEMGAFIGSAIQRAGHRVLWAGNDRSSASTERAAGFEDAGDLASLVAAADSIVCVCPPAAALEVARLVAAQGFRGLYVDANAIAPATVGAIAEVLDGAAVVDGGIIGGPSTDDAVLHLAGPRAADALELFAPEALSVDVLDRPLGAASALKACYAASSKAVTATLLSARAAAMASGVEEALLAEWARTQPEVVDRSNSSLGRIHRKAWRFVGEMSEAADYFAATGVPDGFSRAATETFARLADLRDAAAVAPHEVLERIARGEPAPIARSGAGTA